ncbi:MAG: hypothetical protein QOH03_1778 [Kribbellaceae bacterium]|nr:hypothetical protein [Kribbellaceae bacterium]
MNPADQPAHNRLAAKADASYPPPWRAPWRPGPTPPTWTVAGAASSTLGPHPVGALTCPRRQPHRRVRPLTPGPRQQVVAPQSRQPPCRRNRQSRTVQDASAAPLGAKHLYEIGRVQPGVYRTCDHRPARRWHGRPAWCASGGHCVGRERMVGSVGMTRRPHAVGWGQCVHPTSESGWGLCGGVVGVGARWLQGVGWRV